MINGWKVNQVNHIRSFLQTYAPYTPEIVNKGLDAISPPQSPGRRQSVDDPVNHVNPEELASALNK